MLSVLQDRTGKVLVRKLGNGTCELRCEPHDPTVIPPHSPCTTAYSDELISLIFEAYGAIYTCDEISRDIDESEAALDVKYSVLAYLGEKIFSMDLRILDYGCGAGSSTLTLARLFPHAQISGLDFMDKFLKVARLRAAHYGALNVMFHSVPKSGVEAGAPSFDIVFLNAVFEHLLPGERPIVLESIWRVLKPGGVLILNQTPHRWFPIETHTSGLPLINYLPDSLAFWAVRQFCKRIVRSYTWDELLRAGVRGATVSEILRLLKRTDLRAERLRPIRLANSWAGIWYAAKRARLSKVTRVLTRAGIVAAELVVRISRLPISPYINIAVAKGDLDQRYRTP